jgi:hypothetical protein
LTTFNGVDGRGITAWQSDKRDRWIGKGFRGDVHGVVANRWERAVTPKGIPVRIRQGVKVAVRHWSKELGTVDRCTGSANVAAPQIAFDTTRTTDRKSIDEQLPTTRTT